MLRNHRWTLAARPVRLPVRTDFDYSEQPVREPAEGELVVQVRYISLDPAMRGWMNDARSYMKPIAIGDVFRAIAIGTVVTSRHPRYPVGAHVSGMFGVQAYAVVHGDTVNPTIAMPLPLQLSTLGMPGLTAYFGLLDIGKPVAGQTVVVSGAAGAVGSVVGQIAKIHGCRSVGIAGGREKCAYLTELGFDGAIDYKSEDPRTALRTACPNGIDVFFDNVGGDVLDVALGLLASRARVVICGAISQYNATSVKGPSNYLSLLVNRATMTGMVVMDYTPRFPEAIAAMAGWMQAGTLRSREDIVPGLEHFPETLLKLFRGENFGKLVLEVVPGVA